MYGSNYNCFSVTTWKCLKEKNTTKVIWDEQLYKDLVYIYYQDFSECKDWSYLRSFRERSEGMKIFNASKLIHKNILTDRTINCQLAEDDPSRWLGHQSHSSPPTSTHLDVELGVLFSSHLKLEVPSFNCQSTLYDLIEFYLTLKVFG